MKFQNFHWTSPDVIHPGDYFNCVVDIPTGSDLKAEIEMKDDLTSELDTTGTMDVPGKGIEITIFNFHVFHVLCSVCPKTRSDSYSRIK